MPSFPLPGEHRPPSLIDRLRAGASGGREGVVFMTSLVLGVSAAGADRPVVLVASLGAIVAAPLAVGVSRYFAASVRSIRTALTAATFAAGAAPPALAFALSPETWGAWASGGAALICLTGLGAIADGAGASPWKPMLRAVGAGALPIAFSIGAGLLVRVST